MFYRREDLVATSEVGKVFPQVQSFMRGYDSESPSGIYAVLKLLGEVSKINFIPDLDGIKLAGGARLSDFISSSLDSNNQILSKKAWDVLSKFNLPLYRIYPMGLYKRNIRQDYLWMFFSPIDSNVIDYRGSQFCIAKSINKIYVDDIVITSLQDLLNKRNTLIEKFGYEYTINGIQISIKGGMNISEDLFDFSWAPISGDFVSERLKNAIEEAGLTGWRFTPAKDLKFSE